MSEENADVTDNTDTTDVKEADGPVITEVSESAEEDTEQQGQTDQQSEESEEGQSNKAPEKYSDFNVPKDFEALDEPLLEKAVPLFKELGASQEQAQAFVDMFAESITGHTESQLQALTEADKANRQACETHEEFGGDNFEASQALVAKAVETVLGDKDKANAFYASLENAGLGSDPLIFELLAKVGKSIAEDGIVDGGKSVGPVTTAEVFYGKDGTGPAAKT